VKRLAAALIVCAVVALSMGSASAAPIDHQTSYATLDVNGWSGSAGAEIGHTFRKGTTLTFGTYAAVDTYSDPYNFTVSCATPVILSVQYGGHGAYKPVHTLMPSSGNAGSCHASVKHRPSMNARWRMSYAGCSSCVPVIPPAHMDVIVRLS
jgi:hypothetical protein